MTSRQQRDSSLKEFIVNAKRAAFAGGGKKVLRSDGSKTFTYAEGNLNYTDRYFGSMRDIGEELVWYKNMPIWGMNYFGGAFTNFRNMKSPTFKFLKNCLMLVEVNMPYRGPPALTEREFKYKNKVFGNFSMFRGTESIYYKNKKIYSKMYFGGDII